MNIFKIRIEENKNDLSLLEKFKLLLTYNIMPILIYYNDPILKLITKFSEIKKIIEITGAEITKFFYFHMKKIHNILYDEEKIITFSLNNSNDFDYYFYFYLNLLINEDEYTVNYQYSLETIFLIYNSKINNSKPFKEIIKSKIIINLIQNFDDNDDKYDDELSQLNAKCEKNITNMFSDNNAIIKEIIPEIDKNSIKKMTVSKMYKQIIIGLIIKANFNDYNYIYKIVDQFDLEAIDLTNVFLDELISHLNEKDFYINNYLISNVEDFTNVKKINFNFILLKYILKNPIYIFQIPCLLHTRKSIIKIIKNENDLEKILLLNLDENIKLRIEYIIETITDSKYYFYKYIYYYKYILILILDYYKNFLFESKKAEIESLEKEIRKNKGINYDQTILSDFKKAQILNKRFFIIDYIFSQKNLNSEKEMNETIKLWEILEKNIKEKKYSDIYKNENYIIIEFFLNERNKNSLCDIFEENIYQSFIENIKATTQKSTQEIGSSGSYPQGNSSSQGEIRSNCNNNLTSGYLNNFVRDFEEEKKNNDSQSDNIINNDNKTKLDYVFMKPMQIINDDKFDKDLDNKKDNIKQNKKLIRITEYIREIEHEYFLVGGLNKALNIYDKSFNNIFSVNKLANIKELWIYNALVFKSNIINEAKLAFCCINKICLYNLSLTGEQNVKSSNNLDIPALFCLEMQKNQTDFIAFNDHGIRKYDEFNSKIVRKNEKEIFEGRARSGVWLDENIIGFILFNKTEKTNEIIAYNINNLKVLKKVPVSRNYTINLCQNSLALMEMADCDHENFKDKKVLLFACKKYVKGQKNGILIVNYNFYNDKEFLKVDFERTNFEVYCFCQLSKYKSDDKKLLEEKTDKIGKTNYFLVGGFDLRKGKGVIKLYKLICGYEDKDNNGIIKIKYIDEAPIDDVKNLCFKYFSGAVSCIIQLEKTGNILVGCWDGNVYIFHPPKIKIYDEYESIIL